MDILSEDNTNNKKMNIYMFTNLHVTQQEVS